MNTDLTILFNYVAKLITDVGTQELEALSDELGKNMSELRVFSSFIDELEEEAGQTIKAFEKVLECS